jgi:hypothetical protein
MKTKTKGIGSLLAASLLFIPSFFVASCEQDDGLSEYEMRQQYTLSPRMMGASGEVPGGDPLEYIEYAIGGSDSKHIPIDSDSELNANIMAHIHASWGDGLITNAIVSITYTSSNSRYLPPNNQLNLIIPMGNKEIVVPVNGCYREIQQYFNNGILYTQEVPRYYNKSVTFTFKTKLVRVGDEEEN